MIGFTEYRDTAELPHTCHHKSFLKDMIRWGSTGIDTRFWGKQARSFPTSDPLVSEIVMGLVLQAYVLARMRGALVMYGLLAGILV